MKSLFAFNRGSLAKLLLGAALTVTMTVSLSAQEDAATEDEMDVGNVLGPFETHQAFFEVEIIATDLGVPFALTFLPDGRLLFSDRAEQTLSILDLSTGVINQVEGVPDTGLTVENNAGLSDVVLHPDYDQNGWIYFDYAHQMAEGITLGVSRARLDGNQLVDVEELFLVEPAVPENDSHLGSRIALKDGYLFFTMGERYSMRDTAQDITNHNGTVIRLHDDGRVPDDNPFVGQANARPEIWSYGHRNPQGMAFNPWTGDLWEDEHGPQGGDEVNIIQKGGNYGWPEVTWGREYDGDGGGPIGVTTRADVIQPIWFYGPSIGPSDMMFYEGDAFPNWKGDLFIGGMPLTHLNRLELADNRPISEERLLADQGWRIRSIEEGPDGFIYLGTDFGMIVRVQPAVQTAD